jgi:DNA polymerase I-like protein with 3'-5' exonuclease and polymerase domains
LRRKTINNYAIVDIECTGAINDTYGNPFCIDNNLVLAGIRRTGKYSYFDPERLPFVFEADIVYVGANIKFDLHWLRRYGCVPPTKIWDVLYAQYVIWRQKEAYISLNDCLEEYGFPPKIDVVKTEYWDQGIDTDQVPLDILTEYLAGDLEKTEQVYLAQLKYLEDKPELLRLIRLAMEDHLVTLEMEWNGLPYNIEASLHESRKVEQTIEQIDSELKSVSGVGDAFNFGSPAQLSALLYGGVVKEKYRETYERLLVSGKTKVSERWSEREVSLPPLTKPIKGSEGSVEGRFSVDEDSLVKLTQKSNKKVRTICELLLKRAKLKKLKNSYLEGLPKLYSKMGWQNSILHGTLNHGVTRTGRIASSKPNQQNIPDEVRRYIESRYRTIPSKRAM